MIIFRDFREDDILPIDKIYRKQPWNNIPSLDNVIVNRTIEKDGVVVGYGAVKLFMVATVIIDPDLRKRDKAEAIQGALRIALNSKEVSQYEQLYMTTPFESYADILRNKYGFVNCPNPFLVTSVEDKDGRR